MRRGRPLWPATRPTWELLRRYDPPQPILARRRRSPRFAPCRPWRPLSVSISPTRSAVATANPPVRVSRSTTRSSGRRADPAQHPRLGSSLSIACEGPAGPSRFLSLGFSNIQSGGLSLPFDLGGIGGVAGCRVLGSLDVTTGAVPTNSTALTLTVPVAPFLLGAHLYAQCYVLDLGLGVAVPFATSEAVDLMFGN